MAHELSEASGSAEMFWYGDEPWHGLGTKVDHALTAGEAIKAASLDWEVEKREIFFEERLYPGVFKSAHAYATVRTDLEIPLGIVGKNYKPIQNTQAFAFMDSLTMSKAAKYHTAGALFSGQRVWILAKLPDHLVVLDNDVVDQYLLLCNNHDGQGSLKVLFTPIRVVCMNTLNVALRSAQTTVNIAHTGDIQKKVTEAQRILGVAVNYFKDIHDKYKNFAAKHLTDTDLKIYVDNVFPGTSTKAQHIREKVMELYEVGAGSDSGMGTLWGAYNAVAEYVDHHRTDYNTVPDRYFQTIHFGKGAAIKTKAFEEALNLLAN